MMYLTQHVSRRIHDIAFTTASRSDAEAARHLDEWCLDCSDRADAVLAGSVPRQEHVDSANRVADTDATDRHPARWRDAPSAHATHHGPAAARLRPSASLHPARWDDHADPAVLQPPRRLNHQGHVR